MKNLAWTLRSSIDGMNERIDDDNKNRLNDMALKHRRLSHQTESFRFVAFTLCIAECLQNHVMTSSTPLASVSYDI
ncbi:hypothetical protein OUZ56_007075 [Daphnia magna]|uniref:Uncharacterized protein n=1 Tax=Daphnia magna TaxID=35525 RepID=A0ABQ9YXH8_9CRUS|nr:hypothetical protein OUZ56_007075 [Daphnia magna]